MGIELALNVLKRVLENNIEIKRLNNACIIVKKCQFHILPIIPLGTVVKNVQLVHMQKQLTILVLSNVRLTILAINKNV
jgi:hypothetical protein